MGTAGGLFARPRLIVPDSGCGAGPWSVGPNAFEEEQADTELEQVNIVGVNTEGREDGAEGTGSVRDY